ncbi:MAG: class I SAM-dependent methyltransferase [Deltaproteobacteria bacterium]
MDRQLQEEFIRLQARSAWMASYSIRGHVYGSGLDHDRDVRPPHFFQLVPNARRILELGSCQGGGTFQLARHSGVQEVVALEGRDYNLEKAKFVQQILGLSNITFLEANLETFDFASLGRFDAVYCVGLLYHLPSPWELLARLEPVADILYINTHYCRQAQASMTIHGYEGLKYGELGLEDPLSGMSNWSFWPTLKSLAHMLIDTGFTPEIVETDSTGVGQSPHGTTILARRTAALPTHEKDRLLLKMHELLARQPAVEARAARATFASCLTRAFTRLKRAGQRVWQGSSS